MAKHDVLLDTNTYRKSPARNSLAFQALAKLCVADVVKLHVPYVVEREFETQQAQLVKEALDRAIAAFQAVLKNGAPKPYVGKLKGLEKAIKGLEANLPSAMELEFDEWLDKLKATRHPISVAQTSAAWESYFIGSPLFKSPKVRSDIPDAFIFQSVLSVSTTAVAKLVVITEDAKLANALAGAPKIEVVHSLSDFIGSQPIQSEILDLDVVKSLPKISAAFAKFEQKSDGAIAEHIEATAGDKLVGRVIHSTSIPDDNHEARILNYYEPTDIELNFDAIHYFGGGEFGLPFSFRILVGAYYYIYKADYFGLEDRRISVSDHNNHYYEAEEEFEINVVGLIRLGVDIPYLQSIAVNTLGDHLSIDIDSIDRLSVIGDE